MAQQRSSYLPHVDGLRALAIALVVANHAWPSAVPGGFIGVDMFFVISGFIITRQIGAPGRRDRFGYMAFLSRRIRRLMPAAFVCFVAVSFVAAVVLLPDALVEYARNLVAAVLMYANLYNLHNSGYFSAPSELKPLLHIWSLSIEDQFYLTWPLILMLLRKVRIGAPAQAIIVAGAAALSVSYASAIVGRQPDFAFYVIFPRCFPLLFGCALAIAVGDAEGALVVPMAVDLLAIGAIAASAAALDGASAYPGVVTLPVCVGTCVLILSGLNRQSRVSRLLGRAGPVRLGRISYSLYLWHWPLLSLARYRLGRPLNPLEAGCLVALAVAVSAASWRFVEQPFRATAIVPRRQFGMAAGIIALACGFALAIIGGQGWPWRLDRPRRDLFVEMSSRNPFRTACDGSSVALGNDGQCRFGRAAPPGSPFDIAIFGDSNADHFVPMIADLALRRGLSGRQVTQSTCAPLIGAARSRPAGEEEACTTYQATMLDFLDRNPGLKLAILSAVWSGYDGPLHDNRLAAKLEPHDADFDGFFVATVRLLRARGIKVMIIGQIPHYRTFALPCYLDAVESGRTDGTCGAPRSEIEAELSPSEALFKTLVGQDSGVSLFDPVDVLCGPEVCSPFKDGFFLYHDVGHLDAIGSVALSRYAALPEGL